MEIIDNVLEPHILKDIRSRLLHDSFPWYVESTNKDADNCYLIHVFQHIDGVCSEFSEITYPILNYIQPKAITRTKANFYDGTLNVEQHEWHKDYDWEHKGAIFYLNSNDGYTEFRDGTKVESVENRLLLFDPSVEHRSTSCSVLSAPYRLNMNFNYF